MFSLTAWWVSKKWAVSLTVFSTYWDRWILLSYRATRPLTPFHRRPHHPLCTPLAWNNARLFSTGPTHLAWPAPAGGRVCGLVGKLRPCVFNPWPLLLLCIGYQLSAQMHNLKWRCLRVRRGIDVHNVQRYKRNAHSSTRLITAYPLRSFSTNHKHLVAILIHWFIRFDSLCFLIPNSVWSVI